MIKPNLCDALVTLVAWCFFYERDEPFFYESLFELVSGLKPGMNPVLHYTIACNYLQQIRPEIILGCK